MNNNRLVYKIKNALTSIQSLFYTGKHLSPHKRGLGVHSISSPELISSKPKNSMARPVPILIVSPEIGPCLRCHSNLNAATTKTIMPKGLSITNYFDRKNGGKASFNSLIILFYHQPVRRTSRYGLQHQCDWKVALSGFRQRLRSPD